MGICNASKPNKTRKINKKSFSPKKLKPNNQEKKTLKSDYLFEEPTTKHLDISKYYKLSSEIIGKGASGTVCIGENSTGKYAIKRINKSQILNINDIIKEVNFIDLKHKNIIKYYEVYEDLKTISFVMELGEGGDLFDFISNSPIGHLPIYLCIDLIVQILDVLNYLHNEKGIIHRDLKPENFMITIDNNNNPIIKLIDFGFATFKPEKDKMIDEFLGTPQYASPEIIYKLGCNEKCDIWAAGIIFFNMITGCEPFKGESINDLYDDIKFRDIDFDYITDEKLRNLVMKMLEREVHKRINAKDAYDIALKIKEERDLEYKNEMLEDDYIGNNCNEEHFINDNKREYEEFWSNFNNKVSTGFFP